MGVCHRHRVRPATVALTLVFALFINPLASLPAQAESDGDNRQKLKQLSGETSKLQQLLESFKSQRSQLQGNLQQSEVAIGSVQQKITTIQRQLKQEQASLRTLQDKRQTLNKARQEQQQYIEQQVLAAYQVGQQKKIKILLKPNPL